MTTPDLLAVAVILCITLLLLVSNRFPPDMILLSALALLLIGGILTPNEALAGFSNPGVVTIGILFVVVAGLRETGTVTWLSGLLLGKPRRLLQTQLRLLIPAAAISVLINNSPVVAMFTTAVENWCKRSSFKPSHFLLPLSYASILGGTCSLIGTSTNLVVDGLLQQSGHSGLTLFELSAVGIPISIAGISYLLIAGPILLNPRSGAMENFGEIREYMVEMLVQSNCELAGKTVQEAGLRHLPGLFLIEIIRSGEIIPIVSPHTLIQKGDRLVFAGAVDSVIELRRIRGLVLASDQVFKLAAKDHERRLFEAVISSESPVIGSNIREMRFRHRYNAVILSVARNGRRLPGKIGDIRLQPGDTVLLEAQKGFLFKFRNSRDFLLISRLENSAAVKHEKAITALSLLALMIILIASGTLPLLATVIATAGAMLLSGCLSIEEARRSIDFPVLIVIASAFALGAAVQKVGLAALIADYVLNFSGADPWLTLVLIYCCTALLTECMTNNAAAIVMFPIAVSAAQSLHVNLTPFAITIMIAASASFITPIGYQTNLMVFGPGGYRFSDYIKLGLPLSILVACLAVGIIPRVWAF